jgi:hypothetical protein
MNTRGFIGCSLTVSVIGFSMDSPEVGFSSAAAMALCLTYSTIRSILRERRTCTECWEVQKRRKDLIRKEWNLLPTFYRPPQLVCKKCANDALPPIEERYARANKFWSNVNLFVPGPHPTHAQRPIEGIWAEDDATALKSLAVTATFIHCNAVYNIQAERRTDKKGCIDVRYRGYVK